MRYADPAETNKIFGKNECIKSVFIFLGNYILLMALVVLFIWINTLHIEGQSFVGYITSSFNTLIYLAASLFMLFLTVYFYYIFEDKSILATPKSIWLIFLLLDTCLVICYFFGLFFNIYSRPIALLALLALLLLGRRDAIFLNIIFALMLYSVDHFSNFAVLNEYVNALSSTPLLIFSAGMVGIFVGSKVKTRIRSFLTGFAICVPILVMIACLEYNRGLSLLWLLLYGL